MTTQQPINKKPKHEYVLDCGVLVCKKCGAADNKKPYKGFRYWLRGDGFYVEPDCEYL